MDRYEEEMYIFLTKPENFKAMLKVRSQFNEIRKELLIQFWNKVAEYIELKMADDKKWRVLNPSNKEHNKSKLIIFKDTWQMHESHPFVGVAWEGLFSHPYWGVYSNMNSELVDTFDLKMRLEDVRIKMGFKQDTEWWPMWYYATKDFRDDNFLMDILPDNVNNTVEEFGNAILVLLNDVEIIIDKALAEKSKETYKPG